MEVRIRPCSYGGYDVEKGLSHEGGTQLPGILDFTMPAFIVYESWHADTLKEAERHAKRMQSR